MEFKFDPIEDILEEIREGHIVIMQDAESRENEGDYICAAEFATPENVNRMASEAKGVMPERLTLLSISSTTGAEDTFSTEVVTRSASQPACHTARWIIRRPRSPVRTVSMASPSLRWLS